jgi:hypothetical protein
MGDACNTIRIWDVLCDDAYDPDYTDDSTHVYIWAGHLYFRTKYLHVWSRYLYIWHIWTRHLYFWTGYLYFRSRYFLYLWYNTHFVWNRVDYFQAFVHSWFANYFKWRWLCRLGSKSDPKNTPKWYWKRASAKWRAA